MRQTIKKSIFCVFPVLACLIIGGCAAVSAMVPATVTGSGAQSDTQVVARTDTRTATKTETEQQSDDAVKTISGTVYDATMNTITLITDDRQIYSFMKDDGLVKATEDGIVIGYPVTIGYRGELDQSAQGQNVQVTSVSVSNFEGLTAEQEAKHLLMTLSLEEEAGQMFIVRCPAQNAADIESQYQFGGYILYGDDFKGKSKDEVIKAIGSYQSVSRVPMLIGVDEEGGTVNRVSQYGEFRSEPFASPQKLYAEGGWNAVTRDAAEKCALLKSLGINLNFAPVCDVSTDKSDYIYGRSFGKNAGLTSEYVEKVVEAMDGTGVGCVLKHFPGYGNNADTHTGSADDDRPYATFEKSDFLPFEAGIDAGAGAVLVCHNIVKSIDGNYPASLSAKVHSILRDKLGFDGVIITDDLSMDAIKQFTGDDEAAVLAIKAGNDMLCCRYYEAQFAAVVGAVKSGDIPRSRLDESVTRILAWKINLGIMKA